MWTDVLRIPRSSQSQRWKGTLTLLSQSLCVLLRQARSSAGDGEGGTGRIGDGQDVRTVSGDYYASLPAILRTRTGGTLEVRPPAWRAQVVCRRCASAPSTVDSEKLRSCGRQCVWQLIDPQSASRHAHDLRGFCRVPRPFMSCSSA